jgi:signal transduction histidine kinase/CheY-like chemotaxis protein
MMQGQKNLETVSRLIMSELTPLVSAHHGAFFLAEHEGLETTMKLTSTYAYRERKSVSNHFRLGESLVGQCALEKKTILLTRVPSDYIQISSGLGEATPLNIIVLPVLFEGEIKAVIELASFGTFSNIHQIFLDQLTESIGVVLNMIMANMRTEELLQQSQSLTHDLQSQSQELSQQQEELRRSNSALEKQALELEQKARQLEEQNRFVEEKNREVEQARRSLEEKAEQLSLISKYKSEFLANMSHELRTPLNSLLILAKLLSDNKEANLSPKQVEYASTIYASGGDLLSLINEILDLSKVEAGKMQVEPRDHPMAEIRAFVERGFQPVAEAKGLHFAVEVSSSAPPALRTDPQRLQQVLKNLLSNAFKFTDTGEVRLSIGRAAPGMPFEHPALRAAESVVAFAVRDTGIGIAREKQRLIFEAFQQADGTTSRKYGGTGLGLSISREIAKLLGGEVQVRSAPGQGSTFTLYLPVAWSGEAQEADIPESLVLDSASTLVRPELTQVAPIEDDRAAIEPGDRVFLVIDDDLKFARIMLGMARERGFKGVIATRGDVGLELAQQLLPDAISMDIQLPVLDGWAVLDRLKRDPRTRHIPVHVISVVDKHQVGAIGAFAYLEKPVSKEALEGAFAHISSFLDRDVRRLLLVEDDAVQRESIERLLGTGPDLTIVSAATGSEALVKLAEGEFDCVVFDLVLPDMDGLALLERLKTTPGLEDLPVVVYTGKDLSPREEGRVKRYAQSLITKSDADSPRRLLEDTALFLHRVGEPSKREPVPQEPDSDPADADLAEPGIAGKKVLVVDDDVRNVFALASMLEAHEIEVLYAEDGNGSLAQLEANPDVDLVVMDVMMPGMDGYETMRSIRAQERFRTLPIIAVTAKALENDRERCLQAGASDYLPKPVDPQHLVELMRRWMRN